MTDARSPSSARSGAAAPASDTTLYFAIALTLCWVALLPASLAALGVIEGRAEEWMAGAPLAVFGPTIAAVIAARREGGWASVRDVLRGLGAWRVRPIWWVLALTLPILVLVVMRVGAGMVPGIDAGGWLYLPQRPENVAGLFIVPVCEEIGWRGYALPRLIARHGAHRATAILGALWALWHVPMFVATGMAPWSIVAGLVMIVFGNVVYTWLYRRAGGSLLLAWLFHVGAHLSNPTLALPENPVPLYLFAGGWAVLAIAVLVLDRRAFEGATPEAPGTPPARR
jgi:membrane protease YdiL (CAAX protease family)